MTQYAIKVPFSIENDDWMFVTEAVTSGNFDDLVPVLYDTFEEAEKAAKTWRNYQVVKYNESED